MTTTSFTRQALAACPLSATACSLRCHVLARYLGRASRESAHRFEGSGRRAAVWSRTLPALIPGYPAPNRPGRTMRGGRAYAHEAPDGSRRANGGLELATRRPRPVGKRFTAHVKRFAARVRAGNITLQLQSCSTRIQVDYFAKRCSIQSTLYAV